MIHQSCVESVIVLRALYRPLPYLLQQALQRPEAIPLLPLVPVLEPEVLPRVLSERPLGLQGVGSAELIKFDVVWCIAIHYILERLIVFLKDSFELLLMSRNFVVKLFILTKVGPIQKLRLFHFTII